MEPTALIAYMMTLGALTLTPGPLVAVLAARSACRDRRGACAMAFGICVGDVLVILAICAGLGFWLQAHSEIFSIAKYAGAGLLVLVAIRMWRAPAAPSEETAQVYGILTSALIGFTVCLSSPQTVVIYFMLLPRVVDLTLINAQEIVILMGATVAALLAVFVMVILFSELTQRILNSPRGATLWSRTMSLTIGASAVWVLAG
ncbi:LysE family translocator [Roseovarius sp. C7]|uniref:LysE family translocator n=1 Tax=Roseovarius sp. C7 TaxID=3398643 RepID=UPI0039F730F0